jgi:hypothetical protein
MNPLFAALISSLILTGAPAPQPYPTDVAPAPMVEIALQPGEFQWLASESTPGEVIIVVSLTEQRAYVHRGDTLVAVSTISSGRPGRETPTGVYRILQKEKMHHSNIYDNAPMPFMQRLSWEGLSLHAGRLPGQPSSHGCVRLPGEFAKQLYGITETGGLVVISDDASIVSLMRSGLPDYLAAMLAARSPSSTLLTISEPRDSNGNSAPVPRSDSVGGAGDLTIDANDSNTFANPR